MSTSTLDRTAETSVPFLDVLAQRWSPRAFDAETAIDEDKLASALEAARWSPSASNTQPWRFLVARRGTELHAQIHNALMGFNREWAGAAQVLIVALSEDADADGNPHPWAQYDLGQAVAHLSVQAHSDSKWGFLGQVFHLSKPLPSQQFLNCACHYEMFWSAYSTYI